MQLHEMKVGKLDLHGRKILDVLWATEHYAVYSHSNGISPKYSDDPELAHKQRHAYSQIGPQLSSVQALRTGAIRRTESINREISRAISQSLEGYVEHAHEILVDVHTRLHKLRRLHDRLQYLLSCCAVTLLAIAGLAIALLLDSGGSDLSPVLIMQIAACGAIGGFLSVCVGVRRLNIDPDSGWTGNVVSGGSRIIIAIIGAVFVYFAMVSNLLFGLIPIAESATAIFAVSIAAGFIESVVPNLFAGSGDQSG